MPRMICAISTQQDGAVWRGKSQYPLSRKGLWHEELRIPRNWLDVLESVATLPKDGGMMILPCFILTSLLWHQSLYVFSAMWVIFLFCMMNDVKHIAPITKSAYNADNREWHLSSSLIHALDKCNSPARTGEFNPKPMEAAAGYPKYKSLSQDST